MKKKTIILAVLQLAIMSVLSQVTEKTSGGSDLTHSQMSSTSPGLRNSNNGIKDVNNIEYLIITTPELVEAFKPLAEWKTRKGIPAKIITTTDIYATYNEPSNQLKIKRCLQDHYLNQSLKWVLLGGDDTVVPVQYCYAPSGSQMGLGIPGAPLPTDMFYACFGSEVGSVFDWNADGDSFVGHYGWTNDGVSFEQQIYLTRTPVRTVDHVNAFVNKTLAYERGEFNPEYINTMLLSGKRMDDIYSDGESDAHKANEYLYDNFISGKWNGTRTRFYDTGTDMPGGSSYEFIPTNIQTELNKGYHFFHIVTHGNEPGFGCENNTFYWNSQASLLNNANKMIVTSVACDVNAFDNIKYPDPSISEAFMRNPNGGAVAFLGYSRDVYYTGNDIQGVKGSSIDYINKFYELLFKGEECYLGALVARTKEYYIHKADDTGSYTYMHYTLNALGDPELPIFTDLPKKFTKVTITESNGNITVNTGIENCRITFYNPKDPLSNYWVIDNVSSYTIAANSAYDICITKQGYIPEVIEFGKSITGLDVFSGGYAQYKVLGKSPIWSCSEPERATINASTGELSLSLSPDGYFDYYWHENKYIYIYANVNGLTLEKKVKVTPPPYIDGYFSYLGEIHPFWSWVQCPNVLPESVDVYLTNPASIEDDTETTIKWTMTSYGPFGEVSEDLNSHWNVSRHCLENVYMDETSTVRLEITTSSPDITFISGISEEGPGSIKRYTYEFNLFRHCFIPFLFSSMNVNHSNQSIFIDHSSSQQEAPSLLRSAMSSTGEKTENTSKIQNQESTIFSQYEIHNLMTTEKKLSGKLMLSGSSGQEQVDISSLPTGVYVFTLWEGKEKKIEYKFKINR